MIIIVPTMESSWQV